MEARLGVLQENKGVCVCVCGFSFIVGFLNDVITEFCFNWVKLIIVFSGYFWVHVPQVINTFICLFGLNICVFLVCPQNP